MVLRFIFHNQLVGLVEFGLQVATFGGELTLDVLHFRLGGGGRLTGRVALGAQLLDLLIELLDAARPIEVANKRQVFLQLGHFPLQPGLRLLQFVAPQAALTDLFAPGFDRAARSIRECRAG